MKIETGENFLNILYYIIYNDSISIEERVYESANNSKKHIPYLGESVIGELIGWARPDEYPIRNNRVNKALRALGYDLKRLAPVGWKEMHLPENEQAPDDSIMELPESDVINKEKASSWARLIAKVYEVDLLDRDVRMQQRTWMCIICCCWTGMVSLKNRVFLIKCIL